LDASKKVSKSGIRDPLSGQPHFEFTDKRDAAFAASAPVWPRAASDPDKQGAVDATYFATGVRELHEMVSALVGRVDKLTAEVGSVKQFGGQVSEVMKDLKTLAVSLGKLENLDKIRESLQAVTGILSQLVDAEGNGSQGQASKSTQDSGQGGSQYVS
jgi:hypothetical protein